MIILKIIRSSVKTHKFLVAFIVLSIAASLFCVNVMYGYAESLYRRGYDISFYSTLTLAGLGEESRNTDMLGSVEENYTYEVGSVLYITKPADDIYIIGWDGSDTPDKWWSHVFGSFFTEESHANADKVIYLSESAYIKLEDKTKFTLGGTDYKIIGYGWIIDYFLFRNISEESPQALFNLERTKSGLPDNSEFYIIPHSTFIAEGYQPELILMRMSSLSNSELGVAHQRISDDFTDATVTRTTLNSDEILIEYKTEYGVMGVILALVIWLGMLNIIGEWISAQKQAVYVYRCCGLSKNKMKFIVLLELLLIFAAAEILAVICQIAAGGSLSTLGVTHLPRLSEILLSFGAAYLITILSVYKKLSVILGTKRRVD